MNTKEQGMEMEGIEMEATGIVAELGALGPGALVFESGLARILRRHRISVKRAVERHELPPPTKLNGQLVWTVGAILQHIEKRLAAEAKEVEKRLAKEAKEAEEREEISRRMTP
jgi:hypothetical protein